MDPALAETNQKVDNTLTFLQRELSAIRAGRANPSLVEDISVDAYGSKMKIVELGTISAPQSSLIIIQVWDATIIKDVQKAIMESNLGINPSVEGNVIRLPIPPLTEERREEFIKLVNQKGELAKVEIRRIRASQRDDWDKQKSEENWGEDELDRREKLLQNLIDKVVARIDELVKTKEEELRQI